MTFIKLIYHHLKTRSRDVQISPMYRILFDPNKFPKAKAYHDRSTYHIDHLNTECRRLYIVYNER